MKDKIKALKAFCKSYEICTDCPLEELKCGKGAYFDCGMSDDDINLAYKLAFGTEEEKPHIKDSGNRREFNTGAVRDIQEGKGRCDLLPLGVVSKITNNHVLNHINEFQFHNDTLRLEMALKEFVTNYTDWCQGSSFAKTGFPNTMLEVSKHFEEGCKKYGERNWEKGIPTHCYIDSAVRHYLKWLRGDTDEPHDRAFCWNILCCIWTCQNMPELNDYPIKRGDQNA